VPPARIRALALKELVDNALDAGGDVRLDQRGKTYVIIDDGPGFDGSPEEIAALFSIGRPLSSSKLLRTPLRGALGNGLRVVAGALLASGGGSLVVCTRGQRLAITPREDGSSSVKATPVDNVEGARIEISFGPDLPEDANATLWARQAIDMARHGKTYKGRPSAWSQDADSFLELLRAVGDRETIRDFVTRFDGCSSSAQATKIAGKFMARACGSLTRDQSNELLCALRSAAPNINPERLGRVGKSYGDHYAFETGKVDIGAREPYAELPFIVEAWSEVSNSNHSTIDVFIDRTPIVSEVELKRDHPDKALAIFGCNTGYRIEAAPKNGGWRVTLNIITPYMPIVSDGKSPDLEPFLDEIIDAIAASTRKAQRSQPKSGGSRTLKDIYLDNLREAVALVSDDGKYRFNMRNLFYALRPFLKDELGDVEPQYGTFEKIITDYESEHGEIRGMFRDPRGSLYQPHCNGERLSIGTLAVESFQRPAWTYNKLVFIEKEGFAELLLDERWSERHDCAVLSTKGFSTRAARDLIDLIVAETERSGEPFKVFCVHDADAAGTMIHQTLQGETRARGARLIEIVNIGLEPWEAESMGLVSERLKAPEKRKAVADYVSADWAHWLQSNRYELNAMTPKQFLDWLDAKMIEHGDGKVVPPAPVIADQADERLRMRLREKIVEKLLREARIDDLVNDAMVKVDIDALQADLQPDHVREWLESAEDKSWRDCVDERVDAMADDVIDDDEG
jgi:hypothetical protein